MSIYKDNKSNKVSNEEHLNNSVNSIDDGYDYLDSLMQDVMGTNESDNNSTSEEIKIDDNSKHTEPAPQTQDEDLPVQDNGNEGVNVNKGIQEPAKESKKKRVPLFQQIGIEKEDIEKDKEVSINNIQINVDKKKVITGKKGLFSTINDEEIIDEKTSWETEEVTKVNKETSYDDTEVINEIERKEEVIEEVTPALEESVDEYDNTDDLFDNMLDDLTSIIDEDLDNKEDLDDEENLDPEVEIPLYKPGMEDIKVTADGRTLAEMIPGLRSGSRTVNEVVKNIKEQTEVVEANNKKFSDDRYVKHIKRIEKKRAAQDERRTLSNKFLQRNAKFTEQEKIIMENLGISNEQFANLMGSKELTDKEKEEILALGKYGSEKYFKGRRYRTTVGDAAMLEFLVKFKFANTRILRWISNEPQGRTWRKLNRLRDNGLVESKALIGIPDLWAATPAGVAISGYDLKPGLRPMPKMITVSSTMGINYIAACLWFNTVNVLNLDDFPANNRIISVQENGKDRVRGEMLVSELEIRSSLGKEINPSSTTMQTLGDERLYDVISSNVRSEFEKWVEGERIGESPEFSIGNEFMWVLYPTSQLTLSYHVPDLVVKRERGPNGEPRSIAVEMERYEKDSSRYDKTMLAYKLDEYLYEQVVWITPNTRVARALERSAKNVGFTRYTIVPIITETGVYNKQDIWMI
jgi:hypothetical protein